MSDQQTSLHLEEGYWLIKVPNLVYNSVSNLKPGINFGKLEIETKEKTLTNENLINKKKVKLTSIVKCEDKVLNFELNIDKAHNLFAIKEKKTGINPIIYSSRFVATEELVSDFITEKTHIEEENKKKITLVETGKGRPQNEGIFKISDNQFYYTTDTAEKAVSQLNRKDKNLKRTRKDKTELKSEIFNMFSSSK